MQESGKAISVCRNVSRKGFLLLAVFLRVSLSFASIESLSHLQAAWNRTNEKKNKFDKTHPTLVGRLWESISFFSRVRDAR